MLAEFESFLTIHPLWNTILSALLGVIVGFWLEYIGNRPKFEVVGHGSGESSNGLAATHITIRNNPSFFGKTLNGETAFEISAHIVADEKRLRYERLYWNQDGRETINLAPGEEANLRLLQRLPERKGYCIADRANNPVYCFTEETRQFTIRVTDRLSRTNRLKFTVQYDAANLQQPPSLQIFPALTLRTRFDRAKGGFRRFLMAFKST